MCDYREMRQLRPPTEQDSASRLLARLSVPADKLLNLLLRLSSNGRDIIYQSRK